MDKTGKMIFKKGAASFYIVAFATLILMIIATSFAAIIISEVTRTSNDDLAQSAYDSALAGVEDAKLAFYNYKTCKAQGVEGKKPDTFDSSSLKTCESIVWFMENGMNDIDSVNDNEDYNSCDMVSMMLGRNNPTVSADNEGGTVVSESSGANNMQQVYTCTKIDTSLRDYRSTLSSSQQMRVVKVKFDNIAAKDIKSMRISWYSDSSSQEFKYSNFDDDDREVVYPNLAAGNKAAVPPTIYLGMIQTSTSFTLADFDVTRGTQTNRGMVYLTPTDDLEAASLAGQESYKAGNIDGVNRINADGMLSSNDKTITNKNLPYLVHCPEDSGDEFACSVIVDLPEPINGNRNDDTFVFVVGLPYGKPSTDFAMEFYCGEEGTVCPHIEEAVGEEDTPEEPTGEENVAYLDSVQIKIDSTGRANDLYRRVEARLEGADDYSLSLMGPLELLGSREEGEKVFEKLLNVRCEHNFPIMSAEEFNRRIECQ